MNLFDGQFSLLVVSDDYIYLCRDPVGIKPLYFGFDFNESALLFASELKALLSSGLISARVDLGYLQENRLVGFPLNWKSSITNVMQLEPGTCLKVCPSRIKEIEFLNFKKKMEPSCQKKGIDVALIDNNRSLEEAILSQIPEDQVFGVALSGGLDSSILSEIVSKNTECVIYFNVADSESTPDFLSARNLAKELNLNLKQRIICMEEYIDSLEHIVWAEECPSSFSAAPAYFLAEMAGKDVKVVLGGEGADELYFGYYPHANSKLWLDDIWNATCLELFEKKTFPRQTVEYIYSLKKDTIGGLDIDKKVNQLFFEYGLVHNHLQIADSHFMQFGVEYRVPFLSNEHIRDTMELPDDYKFDRNLNIQKKILKLMTRKYSRASAESAFRSKLGFPSATSNLSIIFKNYCANYKSVYSNTLPRNLCFSGIEGLSYDLFYHIFCVNNGDKPDGKLTREFLRESGINNFSQICTLGL